MTTESYIRDSRFSILGVGIDNEWYSKSEFLADVNHFRDLLGRSAVLCHHAHFDGLILNHHFQIKPKFWLDTLSMARMVHGNHVSASLASLATIYGLEPKNVPYALFQGKRWDDLDEETRRLVAAGCVHDVSLTRTVFDCMAADFPKEEFALIDLTVRMFTEPVLRGDLDLLRKVWYDERDRKRSLLADLQISKEDLRSSAKFAGLLRSEGVEPETKTSIKSNTVFAFAKTDEFIRELREHPNERVRNLVEARLGIKSSLNQTRAETIGGSASRGELPIYLSYCAAHATRWSGGDSVNWQNLPRSGELRKSLLAPIGRKLCVVDLSQIECRLGNWLAGQEDVLAIFKNGGTPMKH